MKKLTYSITSIIGILVVGLWISYEIQEPDYKYIPKDLPKSFDTYYQNKLRESARQGAGPGNEERLHRYSDGKTEYAILYIHGFGASRAEGEYVVDQLSEKLKANTYYVRLPGHGTNMDDHNSVSYADYLDAVQDDLRMAKQLGNKLILIGTSFGGLLSTYLAANYPEDVYAVILTSPFYDFANPLGFLFSMPGGIHVVHSVMGEMREYSVENNPKYSKDYAKHWYTKEYFTSLVELAKVKRIVAEEEVYDKVTEPVLLVYYHAEDGKEDDTASVPAMMEAFEEFGGKNRSPLDTKVAIENGNHVMVSEHVKNVDTESVFKAMEDFVGKLDTQK